MKKKIFAVMTALVLVAALTAVLMTGCTPDEGDPSSGDNTVTEINIVVPDGSPAIALAKLINDNASPEGYSVNYTIVSGAAQIAPAIANGTADIAIAPTNIGATIYNKTGSIKLVSTVVQGALYMVGKEDLSGDTTEARLRSLMGQTVYNIGQGATPDLTFRYILDHFDIPYKMTDVESADYIALSYVSEGNELIRMLKQGTAKYGILGEPAVSRANANAGTGTVFSIQDLWKEATGSQTDGFPQASLFVGTTLLDGNHTALLEWLNEGLTANETWAVENPSLVTSALSGRGSTSLSGLTAAMIFACNLDTIAAADAREAVNTYLTALYKFQPNTVGGKVPDDGFYYVG